MASELRKTVRCSRCNEDRDVEECFLDEHDEWICCRCWEENYHRESAARGIAGALDAVYAALRTGSRL